MPDPLFLPGQTVSAFQLQRLGDEDTFTPTLLGENSDPDLGAGATQNGFVWTNGNRIDVWFTIIVGAAPTFAAGDGALQIPFPETYPPRVTLGGVSVGTVRLADFSAGTEFALNAFIDQATRRIGMFSDAGGLAEGNPITLAEGDGILGHVSYLTDFGVGGALVGGGDDTPPPDPTGQTPAPTIPDFDAANAVTVASGENLATVVAASPAGTHFFVEDGAIVNDVALKANMHVRLAGDKVADGTGIAAAAFRAANGAANNVAIGSDPASPTRARIQNYGTASNDDNQRYAAIQGFVSAAGNTDVDGWFIYGLDFEDNSAGAIFMGSNMTVFDCEASGHKITGIGGDRIVGGLVHTCTLHGNGTDGAGGAAANAANLKLTFVNADLGRTGTATINRAKAPLIVSNCTVEGPNRDGVSGSALRGVWFDVDCQDILVEFTNANDHANFGFLAEGCNNIRFEDCTVNATSIADDGFGDAFADDFIAGAIMLAETTNSAVRRCTVTGSARALVNRLSGRVDWFTAFPVAVDGRIVDSFVIPAVTGQSNTGTGNNTYEDNTLIDCDRVIINEGLNNAFQGNVQGGTELDTIIFTGNDYTGSPGIEFFEASNTALDLAGWQALGRQ